MEDRWLTTEEVAARARTVAGTVRYWRHTGRGPKGTRFGKRVLYRESDVIAWEKAKEAAEAERAGV